MTGRLPDLDDWLARYAVTLTWVPFEGFEEVVDLVPPRAMALRPSEDPRMCRWAAFHGLGHVALHRGNQLYFRRTGRQVVVDKQEEQAERFAARLLCPAEDLRELAAQGLSVPELAEAFDVPEERLEYALSLLPQEPEEVEFGGITGRLGTRRQQWQCAFCDEPAGGMYETRSSDMPDGATYVQRSPLCALHEELLYQAGEDGRVYAGDGLRYWLIER